MQRSRSTGFQAALFFSSIALVGNATPGMAQGNSGVVNGTVQDTSGAAIPGATVTLSNPVSGYTRTTTSDASGQFHFFNLPFNPYRVSVSSPSFRSSSQQIAIDSNLPVSLPVALSVASSDTSITVERRST